MKRRSKWSSITISLTSIIAFIFLLSVATGIWLTSTTNGARTVFWIAEIASKGKIQSSDIHGSLIGGLSIAKLIIKDSQRIIDAEQIVVRWLPADLFRRTLHISRFDIDRIKLQIHEDKRQVEGLPASFFLPLRVLIDHLSLGAVYIEKNNRDMLNLKDVQLHVDYDGQLVALQLNKLLLHMPGKPGWDNQLSGNLHISTIAPFRTQAQFILLSARIREQEESAIVRSNILVSGDFTQIKTNFSSSIGDEKTKSIITGTIHLRPYAAMILDRASVQARNLNLQRFGTQLPVTDIQAYMQIDRQGLGKFKAINKLAGALNKHRLPVYDAAGNIQLYTNTIHIIKSHLNGGLVELHGIIQPDAIELSLSTAELDLRKIDHRLPKSRIFSNIELSGSIRNDPYAMLQFTIPASNNKFLSGQGAIILSKEQITVESMHLHVGSNTLRAHGTLGTQKGILQIAVSAPSLSELGQGFSGSAQINMQASGKIDRSFMHIRWNGHQIFINNQIKIEHTSGYGKFSADWNKKIFTEWFDTQFFVKNVQFDKSRIGVLSFRAKGSNHPSGMNDIALDADHIQYQSHALQNLKFRLKGFIDNHQITGIIESGIQHIQIAGKGSLMNLHNKPLWSAYLTRFHANGGIEATLKKEARIFVAKDRMQLEALQLDSSIGKLEIDHLLIDQERIASRGQIKEMQLAAWIAYFDKKRLIKSTDLRIHGKWDIAFDPQSRAPPKGTIDIERTSGDLILQNPRAMPAGLHSLAVHLSAANHKITALIDARGSLLGEFSFQGQSFFQKGKNLPNAHLPVQAKLTLFMPSLTWTRSLLSGDVQADGVIDAAISLAGSLHAPVLNGYIHGKQLNLFFPDTGIRLQSGMLDCRLTNDLMMLHQLRFAEGAGFLLLSGPISFRNDGLHTELNWQLNQFDALKSLDRQLRLTGSGIVSLHDRMIRLHGDLLIDRGFINIGLAETPRLSGDVMVKGRGKERSDRPFVDLNMKIGLGQHLVIRGRGLNARLGGTLHVAGAPDQPLSVSGQTELTKGTYQAYGRELTIERGILQFEGQPDNPALNIRAVRHGTEVEAGVAITGYAMTPRVTLISEPQVPDAEKLSWLVLGQGLQNADGTQAAALQNAASSLLAQGAAAGVQSQIASALGLDTISMSKSQDSLQENIVQLGKRLSSRLTMRYQQGLQSAHSFLLFHYRLSPRLSIEAETGNRSAFSLFYNFSFD